MIYDSYEEDKEEGREITIIDIMHAMEPILHPDEDDEYYLDNDPFLN